MNKNPSFQFYPADWLSDTKLQSCTLEAQGLLVNLMCFMHQSEKYGFLLINGQKISKKLIKKLGISQKKFQKIITELLKNDVLKKDDNGILWCKRMVEDQRLRDIKKECGKLGGNPNLVNQKVNPQLNQDFENRLTYTSSSVSSTKEKKIYKRKEKYDPFGSTDSGFAPQSFSCDFFSVNREEIIKYQKAYPDVDVIQELNKMDLWIKSNPARKKKNYPRFITNWLSHANKPHTQKFPNNHNQVINEPPMYKPFIPLTPVPEAERPTQADIKALVDTVLRRRPLPQKPENFKKPTKEP